MRNESKRNSQQEMIKNLSIFSTKLYTRLTIIFKTLTLIDKNMMLLHSINNFYKIDIIKTLTFIDKKHDAPTTLTNKSKRESNMHGIQRGNKCHFQQNVDFVLFVKILHHNVIQKRVI